MFLPKNKKPPWRNGLACWTSNSKVVGSSPTGGEFFLFENTRILLFIAVFIFIVLFHVVIYSRFNFYHPDLIMA